PEALVNKGNALLGLGRIEDAVPCYEQALRLAPGHSNANYNLGNAYMDLGEFGKAVESYRAALMADAKNPEKHFNLANALMMADRLEESLPRFECALNLRPDYVDALCNHASALQSLGRTEEALARLQKALAFQPDSVDLHWNLALAALQHGDYKTGWREYEWRWQMPTFADFRRDFEAPAWIGEPLDGKTLFVHTEQGFGDNLQFCRFIPLVAAKGARVVLECRPQLRRLFATLEGAADLIDLGDAVPDCDYQIPLMSLPFAFATELDTVPADVPYLTVPAGTKPAPQIAAAEGLKVGFAWAGSPTRVDNEKRSIDLGLLAPLFEVPDISFFSLQVGPRREQLAELGNDRIVDLTDEFSDFGDTAASVTALDLVISVDTSILHLAGALGRTAWGMMSQPTGFLWMNDRADSPWYPSLRLFRQDTPGRWQGVVSAIRDELTKLTGRAAG
ncbi:MAG: tetratricopeptide repeat protein, partial [Rhodospirillaceae bacterium]